MAFIDAVLEGDKKAPRKATSHRTSDLVPVDRRAKVEALPTLRSFSLTLRRLS